MKHFLKAVALGAAMLASPAQALVIGTADSANSIPFGSTLGGYYFQQVYDKTTLGTTLDIAKLSFYNTNYPGGTPRAGSFQLYLSTTMAAISTFDTNTSLPFFDASFTKVFDGPLPALASGRLDLDLATLFHYDPAAGNLLLTVRSFDFLAGSVFLDAYRNDGVTNSRFSAYPYDWNQGLVTGFTVTNAAAAPEPASLALFGAGLLGLLFPRRARSG